MDDDERFDDADFDDDALDVDALDVDALDVDALDVDALDVDGDEYDDATAARIDHSPRRRTVKRTSSGRRALGGGALMTAVALGFQQVFEPPDREEVVLEVGAAEPDPDQPVDLYLVPEAPARSRARVRPWLIK